MEHGAGVGRPAGEIEFQKNLVYFIEVMVRSEGAENAGIFKRLFETIILIPCLGCFSMQNLVARPLYLASGFLCCTHQLS